MDDFILDIGLDLDLDLDGFASDEPSKISNRYVLPKIHRQIKTLAVKYERAEEFVESCGQHILDGETVHALLSGNFIFGDFFEALAVKFNLLIDDLTLSTLSFGQDNIDSFHNLLSGDYLKSLNIVVSDYFWSHNRQNAPYIYNKLDIDDMFQLAVSGTHTKVALMRIGDKKIVITGSANLRSSRSVEEFSIQTNDELYDFHMEWHDEILREYGTIKKAVRASKLFDLITKNTESKKSWLNQEKAI